MPTYGAPDSRDTPKPLYSAVGPSKRTVCTKQSVMPRYGTCAKSFDSVRRVRIVSMGSVVRFDVNQHMRAHAIPQYGTAYK